MIVKVYFVLYIFSPCRLELKDTLTKLLQTNSWVATHNAQGQDPRGWVYRNYGTTWSHNLQHSTSALTLVRRAVQSVAWSCQTLTVFYKLPLMANKHPVLFVSKMPDSVEVQLRQKKQEFYFKALRFENCDPEISWAWYECTGWCNPIPIRVNGYPTW